MQQDHILWVQHWGEWGVGTMGTTGLGVCVETFYQPIQDSLQIFSDAEDQYLSFMHLKRRILPPYTFKYKKNNEFVILDSLYILNC